MMTVRELMSALIRMPGWEDEVIAHYDGSYPADIVVIRLSTDDEAQQRGKYHVVVQVET